MNTHRPIGGTWVGHRPRWLLWWACGALVASLAACSHGLDIRAQEDHLSRHRGESGAPGALAPVVVIAEPFFSGGFESYEVYQKTYDVVEALTDAGVPAVAPWEYQRLRKGQGALLDTDVGQLLRAEGVDPGEALWMELRVVMLGGTSRVGLLGEEETIVGVSAVQTGEIRVKLRDIHSMEELASVVVAFVEDGLSAEVSAFDRRPALTRSLRQTVGLVAGMVAEHYPVVASPSSAEITYNPKPMFSFEVNGAPPLSKRFEKLDALDALVGKLRYYQYFDPTISVDHLMDFEARSAGLLVKSPGAFLAHGLQAGDFIVSVDGRPALGPQVLARPLLSRRQDEVALLVERGNRPLRVVIPVPSGPLVQR